MKGISIAVSMMAASLLFSVVPVLADDGTSGLSDGYGVNKLYELKGQKDECLIVARNCYGSEDDVMQRVNRLRKEIYRGSDVYSPEELKSLNDQLEWIYSESKTFFPQSL